VEALLRLLLQQPLQLSVALSGEALGLTQA
jgi:hypothetical protein